MFRLENQDNPSNPQRYGNVRVEYPFTVAQWKELQRQAMVYKYLVASIPVPPHLLSQVTETRFSSNCNYSLRFGTDGDPEPGRCKRTDGKKWRCSKEAIPNERYCDRHLKKRGHTRSRKLVENVSCKKARHGQKLDSCSKGSGSTNSLPPVFLCCNGDGGFEHGASLVLHKEPRALDWVMIGETCRPEDNCNVYTGYDASKMNHHQFNEYPFSHDSDPVRTPKPDPICRGGFLDGMGQIHMGLGVASWVGGPLGEVLQHRSASPSSESHSPSSARGGRGSSSSLTVEAEMSLQG